jgi:acyl dehydratase
VQRHQRVYARLRRAMAHKGVYARLRGLCGALLAEPGPFHIPEFGTVPAQGRDKYETTGRAGCSGHGQMPSARAMLLDPEHSPSRQEAPMADEPRSKEPRSKESLTEDPQMRHQRGGIYFDDFVIGRLYQHRLTRTVTQMDNMLFSNMTLNPQPLHIDRHYCERETEWGQPLMNSLFTLGLMIGISVNDLTVGTTVANLGMTEVKFPHPLFEGDTVHCSTTVLSKRESKSRPGMGIVEFEHRAFNQDDRLVAQCRRQALMRMRPR